MTSTEQFEQAIKARFGDSIDYRVCKNSDGEYMAWDMQDAWWAWQAASKASEQQLLELSVKLANVESKCAELAAENAGLKSVLEEIINGDEPEYHEQGMGCGVEDRGYQRDGYSACSYGWESAMERIYSEVIPSALPETPATDAYLAEVRAQGADKVATACRWLADKDGCSVNMQCSYNLTAERAEAIAAQLRQGVEHE